MFYILNKFNYDFRKEKSYKKKIKITEDFLENFSSSLNKKIK